MRSLTLLKASHVCPWATLDGQKRTYLEYFDGYHNCIVFLFFLLAVTVIVSPQFSHLYFPSNLDDVSIPRDYAKQTCFLTLRHTAVLNLCSASYFVKNCIVILFTCAAPVCILHTLYMYLSIYLILYVSSVILDFSICIIYIYVSFYNQEIVYSSLESLLSLFGYLNICAD